MHQHETTYCLEDRKPYIFGDQKQLRACPALGHPPDSRDVPGDTGDPNRAQDPQGTAAPTLGLYVHETYQLVLVLTTISTYTNYHIYIH